MPIDQKDSLVVIETSETANTIDISGYRFMTVRCPCGFDQTFDLSAIQSRYWHIPPEFWQHECITNSSSQ